jgi:hypothetical protein
MDASQEVVTLHRRLRCLTKAVRGNMPEVFIIKEAELIAKAYEALMKKLPLEEAEMRKEEKQAEKRFKAAMRRDGYAN